MSDITQEQRRLHEYEQLKRERLRTDEITYASEALAAPMNNSFAYELRDGDLWYQGQTIVSHLDQSIKAAEQVVKQYPQFQLELLRRRIERTEYDAQLQLASGSDKDPDMFVVMSSIPDAVVDGLDLGAYDVDRKKTMVRIYTRTENGIEARSLSLDLSDRQGLQAIAGLFGYEIPDDATSEDILQMRLWGWTQDYQHEPVTEIRQCYDAELAAQTGGEWYAGRQDDLVLDARQFIDAQEDLISEHIGYVTGAHAAHPEGPRLDRELKNLRYNFVEALSRRLRGDSELSMSEAGEIARAAGVEHKTDCPDGEGLGVTGQMVEQMGIGVTTFVCQSCPICGSENITAQIAGETIRGIECGCSRNICTGAIVRGPGRQPAEPTVREQTRSQLQAWKREIAVADEEDQQRQTIQVMEEMLRDMASFPRQTVDFQEEMPLLKTTVHHPTVLESSVDAAAERVADGFTLDLGRLATFTRIQIGGGEREVRDALTGEVIEDPRFSARFSLG